MRLMCQPVFHCERGVPSGERATGEEAFSLAGCGVTHASSSKCDQSQASAEC